MSLRNSSQQSGFSCASLIPKHQRLIVLKTSDTVKTALETFQERHFRSCPVQDDAGAVAGFLDVLDIVAYIISSFPRSKDAKPLDAEKLQKLWSESKFLNTTIKDANLINFSRFNPWLTLPKYSPLEKAISIFATGVHHIALTEDEKPLAVLSQSDIVRFMNADVGNRLGSLAKKTVQELGFTLRRVKVAQVSSPAIDAFFAMQRAGLSCVAVVDSQWKLVGNLSASDITLMNSISFVDLTHPLSQYIRKLEETVYRFRPVVAVDSSTTFENVVQLLCHNRIHHVFVVDADDKPIGIITLTDVLSMALAVVSGDEFAAAITPSSQKLESSQKEESKREQQSISERYLEAKKAHERSPSEASAKRVELLHRRMQERLAEDEALDARARTGAVLPPASSKPTNGSEEKKETVNDAESERLALIRKRMAERLEREREMAAQYSPSHDGVPKPTQLDPL